MRYLALLLLLCFPTPAFAWRQTQTCLHEDPPAPTATPYCVGNELAKPMHWPTPQVSYAVNEAGSDDFPTADGLIDPQLLETIQASFQTWNEPECSDFEFAYEGTTSANGFDADDGLNLVVFKNGDSWPYGSMALAITSVTADGQGIIVNADMELNSSDHQFAIVEGGETGVWDVQNTITHEAGHILGLDHDAVPDSTMEFEASFGETKKRDLLADDIEGLCTIYPSGVAMDPVDEPDDPDEGCCATISTSPSSGRFLLFPLVGLWWRRRRRGVP